MWDGGTLVRSAPDAVALVLDRHFGPDAGHDQPLKQIAAPDRSVQPAMFPAKSLAAKGTNGHAAVPTGQRCPDCGVGSLVHQEGCKRCLECGYNKCE